jgi:hypothetical protein
MDEIDWDKVIGIGVIGAIAITAMFLLPEKATEIVVPAVTAIAGFVTGRATAKIGA